mmetsp:Transcript_5959/g.6842  ORF Transcript_5959/g.6842 Transcript_5959/m.6842 type:complete len:196 (-) Transcript_5959:309-896(-)|eukprot:CAMPEP_0184021346 /NCGR_PEP_ID=MMETSP0954-20121128/9876_1 /TAXON_ID=627963 /ORGANISM="Aplanochytrium sp, Strain PBS07" /LENGTH=195 /DNA_ID=CAMNT_0026303353 /DNA_START=222 /DNA_END=809 /DNA_ORIENTATION=-
MKNSRHKVILTIWLLIQVCQISYVVSAWKAFSHLEANICAEEPTAPTVFIEDHRAAAFTLIWMSIIAFILSVTGVVVMRRIRSETALGFFIGVTFIMWNWWLILAVQAGDTVIEKKYVEDDEHSRLYVEMKALFAVLQFFLYMVFGILILTWRDDLVEKPADDERTIEMNQYEEDDICTKSTEYEKPKSRSVTIA